MASGSERDILRAEPLVEQLCSGGWFSHQECMVSTTWTLWGIFLKSVKRGHEIESGGGGSYLRGATGRSRVWIWSEDTV